MKSDPAMKDRRSRRCTVIASATALLAACAGGAGVPEAALIETVRCVNPDWAPVAGTRLELHDGSDDPASWRSDAVVADATGVARIRRPQLAGGRTSWL